MVTDLDPHLVQRALTSLGAELTRREHVLAAAAVGDLSELERAGGSLGRLVIVIDEFASLVRELPDFVKGLVSIAQRGRSLGLHLVLATQRPTGVVSPEIRANTDLRIALRMTDAHESTDVVDVADAARIPRDLPGRGVVRLGQGVLAAFQTGRVGGAPPSAARTAPTCVTRWSWPQLGRGASVEPSPEPDGPSDLAALVDALVAAGELTGARTAPRPWLPALPDAVELESLSGAGAPYALLDVPAEQAQPVASWDPDVDGHLLVVGAPRSGRTQLLRTLATSLALHRSTRDLHLHALDCGGGGLLGLEALPHCGAVVTREQPERVGRLLTRLVDEVTRRQALMASEGFASLKQAREAGRALAHVVLLLDRWEGFATGLGELDGGALQDHVLTLLREGSGVGVHVVATGDRSLLLGRVGATTPERIVLRLADRGDYAVVGLDPRSVPDSMPPGRAVHVPSGAELQVAVATSPLADVAARCAERDAAVDRADRPFRVDALPARVSLAQVRSAGPPLFAVLGLGGDELRVVGTDLAVGPPSLLVSGPARSGRSTSLVALARSFLDQGAEVVLAVPRPSPLRLLAGTRGVRAVLTELTTDALSRALERDGPVVVLLDDAELLRDCPAATLLAQLVTGAVPGRALVVAGSPEGLGGGFTGWHVQARQARQGLLLSPRSVADGELLGCRLPRHALGGPVLPGRGLAHLGDGRLVPVQVPV
jgi:S-DNA-T family DNA segregation ATPase FtsK/SpoIIIE